MPEMMCHFGYQVGGRNKGRARSIWHGLVEHFAQDSQHVWVSSDVNKLSSI